MRSRQTAAMQRLLDVPELNAGDQDDYARITAEPVRSSALRESLRLRIGEHRARLFYTARSVTDLDSIVRSAQPVARRVRPNT
jgi:hypothetical protein